MQLEVYTITLQANISSFTNKNIRESHVVYLHDDSEHDEDSFTFMATPVIEQPEFLVQEISEFSGQSHILCVSLVPSETIGVRHWTLKVKALFPLSTSESGSRSVYAKFGTY